MGIESATINMPSAYWLLFVVRRILFACFVVFAYDSPALATSFFLIFAIANLPLIVLGNLWDQDWVAL